MSTLTSRLLPFARELQRAASFDELLTIARGEVEAATPYRHTWMFVAEAEDFSEVRLLAASGNSAAINWEHAPVLKVAGDAMMEEIVRGDAPVVVVDARTDPRTNKEIVARIGNRTIINIPLRLLDKPFGVLGVGTYGDEACIAPSDEQLDYLVAMSAQVAVAAGRIRMHEERRVAESRQRSLEQQLFRAQRLESVALLAGGLAHDFNNLLTVILSGAELAAQRAGGDCEELRAVEEAAHRGHQLTRQLLAVSRSQPLTQQVVDLNELLRKLLTLVQRIVPENVRVELAEHAAHPAVLADPSMLDQVFLNLCVNARDAMPQGGRLTITTADAAAVAADEAAGLKPGPHVLVTLADTGTGMPPEVLDRVFEPFFTTKAPGAGTGLGLAVAYGIVRQHGGALTCASTPGAGTTFTVHLPAASGRSREAVAAPVLRIAAPHGSGRILLAEDDPDVRSMSTRVLEYAGYTVTAVPDGETALQRVSCASFDLVVLDVVMPGISGVETLRRIRATQPGMRFVLVSGYAPSALALERVDGSGVELCEKPYRPEELIATVGRALGARANAG